MSRLKSNSLQKVPQFSECPTPMVRSPGVLFRDESFEKRKPLEERRK